MHQCNFQIQYFPDTVRQKFKDWAHKNGMSMKELLTALTTLEPKIQPLIPKKKKKATPKNVD